MAADDGLLRELYDAGLTDAEIARRAKNVNKDQVRRWRNKNTLPPNYLRSGEQIEREYIASISDKDDWPLPVRPVEIQIPNITTSKPKQNSFTSIHYGDVHYPFQDDAALKVLYAITEDLNPDLVVCHGDLLDCYKISKYQKNPKHRIDLQDEVVMAAEHLGIMTSLAPDAERWLLLGNHEDRIRRLVWDMAEALPAAQLLRLPNVWEQIEWPKILGTDQSGWQVFDGKKVLFDKLVLKHGSVVRQQSAYTARAELERYQKSGISGHTHRRGVFEKRDLNGHHAWFEHGCLCDLNPDYVDDPNWASGFLVVTWTDDRSRFGVEEVRIHDGMAIFRGRSYGA